ncbi:hypothetical protein [Methylocystis bryophila]|uniref:Uncharacterized protein n=1 Tax=Methylocystis bryophila TaxID=655015 RepID=A0A1W6MWA2_9HYPH|nr:hypothetical protein [Methylocystis bryophila]ARN81835.1 hypothetical protein B1812_12930 [Methylocystis bryophila]BDV37908.1 hypothetical protein DSM21852_11610 [Methylocystis bryophila]
MVDGNQGALERARIVDILSCEEAKGRESLAQFLALKTRVTVDDARTALAAAALAPQAAPPKPRERLLATYAARHPEIMNARISAFDPREHLSPPADGAPPAGAPWEKIIAKACAEAGVKPRRG